MRGMTTAEASPPLSADAAISAAVHALLADRSESVSDLAYHTRISVASLYRKLSGGAAWKAADVEAVARHYRLAPGDLFLGSGVTGGGPRGRDPKHVGTDVTLRNLSSAFRGRSRTATPRAAVARAA